MYDISTFFSTQKNAWIIRYLAYYCNGRVYI